MQVFNRCFTIKIFSPKSQILKNLKSGTPASAKTLGDFKAQAPRFPESMLCGGYRCSPGLTSLFDSWRQGSLLLIT